MGNSLRWMRWMWINSGEEEEGMYSFVTLKWPRRRYDEMQVSVSFLCLSFSCALSRETGVQTGGLFAGCSNGQLSR